MDSGSFAGGRSTLHPVAHSNIRPGHRSTCGLVGNMHSYFKLAAPSPYAKYNSAMKILLLDVPGLHLGYLGCYGNDWVATPHLDRLASESIVFDRHFAAGPGGLATGRYRFPTTGAGEEEGEKGRKGEGEHDSALPAPFLFFSLSPLLPFFPSITSRRKAGLVRSMSDMPKPCEIFRRVSRTASTIKIAWSGPSFPVWRRLGI